MITTIALVTMKHKNAQRVKTIERVVGMTFDELIERLLTEHLSKLEIQVGDEDTIWTRYLKLIPPSLRSENTWVRFCELFSGEKSKEVL